MITPTLIVCPRSGKGAIFCWEALEKSHRICYDIDTDFSRTGDPFSSKLRGGVSNQTDIRYEQEKSIV